MLSGFQDCFYYFASVPRTASTGPFFGDRQLLNPHFSFEKASFHHFTSLGEQPESKKFATVLFSGQHLLALPAFFSGISIPFLVRSFAGCGASVVFPAFFCIDSIPLFFQAGGFLMTQPPPKSPHHAFSFPALLNTVFIYSNVFL